MEGRTASLVAHCHHSRCPSPLDGAYPRRLPRGSLSYGETVWRQLRQPKAVPCRYLRHYVAALLVRWRAVAAEVYGSACQERLNVHPLHPCGVHEEQHPPVVVGTLHRYFKPQRQRAQSVSVCRGVDERRVHHLYLIAPLVGIETHAEVVAFRPPTVSHAAFPLPFHPLYGQFLAVLLHPTTSHHGLLTYADAVEQHTAVGRMQHHILALFLSPRLLLCRFSVFPHA